ncbi:hypothetical protein KSF_063580 [Reticulibacter mediterranei]|uniref:Uncharacterized protein n=1 Tax=Reticulibacter mediterranei TaxID=2778369 RepID=A0A8J3N5E8_9CHLR|nr:hypothetical protein [Reticulibacter mediterranei]GHO96310.1 hypothetical protein KSF_063580 [Reticulibacter mediterranei]
MDHHVQHSKRVNLSHMLVNQLLTKRALAGDKEIALRNRAERRKQHAERMARICTEEIHQVVVVLHQQGIYPRSIQVAKQLNNSHILRLKEARKI